MLGWLTIKTGKHNSAFFSTPMTLQMGQDHQNIYERVMVSEGQHNPDVHQLKATVRKSISCVILFMYFSFNN